MNNRRSLFRRLGELVTGLAIVVCPACSTDAQPDPERYLPTPQSAQGAIQGSLEAWRRSPDLEKNNSQTQPFIFVDQTRKPGQQLREFAILRVSPGSDGCRRFQVKLVLEQPAETILASYYVFGQGPVWVYRAEDFEMMMHMDPMTKTEPPGPAAGSDTKDDTKAKAGHEQHLPKSEAP